MATVLVANVMNDAPTFAAHYRATDDQWQSLDAHLFGVADLARCFAAKLGLQDQGELLGLLHDFGKYSQAFQTYLKSATGVLNQDEDEDWVDADSLRGKIDHSSAGAQFVWRHLTRGKPPASTEFIAAQAFAICIASHHSGLVDCVGGDGKRFGDDVFGTRINKSPHRTHLEEAASAASQAVLTRAERLLSAPSLVAAIASTLERIVTKEREARHSVRAPHLDTVTQFKSGLLVRFLFSCLIDADRIDTADFENRASRRHRQRGKYAEWQPLIDRLEQHLAGFESVRDIDRIRADIARHCFDGAVRESGRIYTLTVPTGGGKTLAALRFALHHSKAKDLDRIVFVVPFTSIIDQNSQVARGVLEPGSDERGRIVLEHHSNITPEHQSWREKILSENWDAPVIYTTSVQFLETLFGAGTRGARRMHQLARAVIVFDEVQALPVRCVHLFNNAINFLTEHCQSTVVLCTATQPLLQKVDPDRGAVRLHADHELMPDVGELFRQLKRVNVVDARQPGGWADNQIADLAVQSVRECGSCLVIVNTKRSAESIYRDCVERSPEIPIFHLSTQMCAAHRREVLAVIRKRLAAKLAVLCVSTQLIEAGVDVDFGCVIRFLAGLDSIAQAAGRCNRHGARRAGVVHILNPRDESLDKLLDIRIGRDIAERVLDEFKAAPERFAGDLIGPTAMTAYYEYYFFARKALMDYCVGVGEIGRSDTLLNMLSVNSQAVEQHARHNRAKPATFLRQAFMSAAKAFKAIDAPTQGVIVPYADMGQALVADLSASFDVSKDIALLRSAQQYAVNVFPHVFEELDRAGALHTVRSDLRIYTVDRRYYSEAFGLTTEPSGPMENLHV